MIPVDDALKKLQTQDPIKARLIDLRFFAGLTNEEAAEVLGLSTATAKRYWRYARALLRSEVRPGEPPQAD